MRASKTSLSRAIRAASRCTHVGGTATAVLPRAPPRLNATLQLGAQEQFANVSKLLGHANLSTTADLYAHLAPATERRAADTMDRLLA